MAVREVPAVREVHAEHRVARLEHRDEHAHVGLRAGVRLHVGVLGAEERLGAVDGQGLGHVHELAAAVVALARIPLGVLVGEHGSGGFEDGRADEVLRRDELEAGGLPLSFVRDGRGNRRGRYRQSCAGSARSACGGHLRDCTALARCRRSIGTEPFPGGVHDRALTVDAVGRPAVGHPGSRRPPPRRRVARAAGPAGRHRQGLRRSPRAPSVTA